MPWQPRCTARINARRINLGDIILSMGNRWILVDTLEVMERDGYVELWGHVTLDHESGTYRTGKRARLSAAFNESRTIGWP